MKEKAVKEKFIELRVSGKSYERISKELDVSKQTLINWSKELTVEIKNLTAIEQDTLQEKYYMAKRHRIYLLGEQLLKLRTELEKRDLSDVSTKDVFAMLLKCSETLAIEQQEIKFIEKGFGFDMVGNTHSWIA